MGIGIKFVSILMLALLVTIACRNIEHSMKTILVYKLILMAVQLLVSAVTSTLPTLRPSLSIAAHVPKFSQVPENCLQAGHHGAKLSIETSVVMNWWALFRKHWYC